LDLELPWDRSTAVAEHLSRYIVADRVEMVAPSDGVRIDLVGPRAATFVADRAGSDHSSADSPDAGESSLRQVELGGVTIALEKAGRFGASGFSTWLGAVDLAALLGTATGDRDPALPPLVGHQAWETVRVEAGVPRFGQDFDSENLPQETDLDEAVSYTKGCYLGQEIVARIHYRGQVPRGPRSLRLEGDECPPCGGEIRFEGHEVGRLTSVVRSPAHGFVLGLALLHRRAWKAGTHVEIVGAGGAEVMPVESGTSAGEAGE
jgi:folate-binding protein YgfZ